MECNCGVEIEAWRELCKDCEILDVMGAGPDRRFMPKGDAMRTDAGLRSGLKSKMGHDVMFYVLRWPKRGLVKIGATSNLDKRIRDLVDLAGEDLFLVASGRLTDYGAETAFHSMMNGSSEKFSGEWYYWTPRIEALVEKLKLAPRAA